MKRIAFILSFVLMAVLSIAQDDSVRLDISGQLLSDQRVLMNADKDWAWNENRLTLNLDKTITNYAKFHGELWVRNLGLPSYYRMSAIYNKGIVDPVSYEIREAYVQVNNFLINGLDATFGRQIIHWGTADKINPTDNINPLDLEDVLDFGRRRGTDAIRLDYYFGNNFSVEAVAVPFFRPANLPVGIYANLLSPQDYIHLPQGLTMASFTDSLIMPAHNLGNQLNLGFRIKGNVAGFDLSVSYLHGRETLPMIRDLDLTPDMQGNTDVIADFYYPRVNIIGADMAGNIAGIGVWAEGAAFMPEEDLTITTRVHTWDLNQLPPQPITLTQDTIVQEKNKPYFKYVLGADYNFPYDIYLNFQFIHGFLHERFKGQLNDYYFLRLEKTFFYGKLKIAPISGGLIVSDYKDLKNNYSVIYLPQVIYQPTINTEITLSAGIFGGKGKNLFSRLNDMDLLMLSVKYEF